jgi:hypothetical protein
MLSFVKSWSDGLQTKTHTMHAYTDRLCCVKGRASEPCLRACQLAVLKGVPTSRVKALKNLKGVQTSRVKGRARWVGW